MSEQQTRFKQQAAEHAVTFVKSGMIVGLGAGSTAVFALRKIAQLLAEGELHDIAGIPCSTVVEQEARSLGIPLTTLNDHPSIDLTIDGADEVDPELNLIKGGGGALLREKIIAQASRREMIVVDQGKLSPRLGTQWAVPIEVLQFSWAVQSRYLESLGARVTLRESSGGTPFITDEGNFILDCAFGPISNLDELADNIIRQPGIVEHGLFLGLATDLIIASEAGIRHVQRGQAL